MMVNDDQSFTFALGACLRPAIFATAQQNDANTSNYGTYRLNVYRGSSCKRTEKWQNVCLIAFNHVCGYWYLASVYACAMLCTSPRPADANLALPALIVEPPHAAVQVHHEASASYISSLAMAVWRPHTAPYLNHSSVFHSLILWKKHHQTSLVVLLAEMYKQNDKN